jgi:hypothetical protein
VVAAGGQAPGPLHIWILYVDDGAHPVAIGHDLGATQHAGTSVGSQPGGSGAGFTHRGGDGDIAAETDDAVEEQLFSRHAVELLVAEAGVGDNARLGLCRQRLGQPHRYAMLVKAARVLEHALVG